MPFGIPAPRQTLNQTTTNQSCTIQHNKPLRISISSIVTSHAGVPIIDLPEFSYQSSLQTICDYIATHAIQIQHGSKKHLQPFDYQWIKDHLHPSNIKGYTALWEQTRPTHPALKTQWISCQSDRAVCFYYCM